VVVRYHGKHSGKAVLFMGHLDVVEAKPEDWSTDPFKLTEKTVGSTAEAPSI
jgi:acetylornithine deacetylase/succinyl-diaminopimelate desuccinylase-like protein